MIESIQGVVVKLEEFFLSISLGPIQLKLHFFGQITPKTGDKVTILTHMIWKEDGPQLYGFLTEEELNIFQKLTKITGIGPKTAGRILKTLGAKSIESAVQQGDIESLSQVRGLSAKMAQRILVDLKCEEKKTRSPSPTWCQEAKKALVQLGLSSAEANQLIQETWSENRSIQSLEELIRLALMRIPKVGSIL
ncbi:Holliday junction branch migration protein RuvA [Candidatus Similichlamydia epinepheli]|uniref:Holliday junction branch migration protein RuvA n=1 Tax=Candidatus Similichlamydia epinepheli TaxID=1903953 RepID=UPI000D333476|nr:Holliday junction branch migration protein RuvA [Candidatus Similichlamydia epinepheli]